MDFLRTVFGAIPEAAKSPLALVAYTVALTAWLLVSLRVSRNRNLLLHLRDLPERDRLKALKAEMGHVEVKGGLTAEQYLRSQLFRYYLTAFLVLCLVLVLIIAISAYSTAKNDRPDRKAELAASFGRLDLGMQKDSVQQLFGTPIRTRKEGGLSVACYSKPLYSLVVIYGSDNAVVYYGYSTKDRNFHPQLPLSRRKLPDCLGCFPLKRLDDDPRTSVERWASTARSYYYVVWYTDEVNELWTFADWEESGAFKYTDVLRQMGKLQSRSQLTVAEKKLYDEFVRWSIPRAFSRAGPTFRDYMLERVVLQVPETLDDYGYHFVPGDGVCWTRE